MSGIDKAREVNEKIKEGITDTSIALIQADKELLKMYEESSKMGSQNLQGAMPMLKIHTTNKSLGNELASGGEPNDGWFFLTGLAEQFQNPICHILTISKGFKAKGMADKTTGEVAEDKFNQIMGGVIVDGKDYKPFLMYFTGTRLSRLWDFGKEVSKFTHAKPVSVPMFALSVKLSTEKVKHAYGSSYVVNFEVVKNSEDNPVIITDAGEFVFLRDSVNQVEETIESLIATKSTEENIPSIPSGSSRSIDDIVYDEETFNK